jgi:hypothetical protein
MKKVAKLVSFTLTTRVIVDESASDNTIIKACYPKILDKINNRELGDNLESIEDDEECPCGTFDTDEPVITKVILSTTDKAYAVIGTGLPVQVKRFDDYSDWDSVNGMDGLPLFDVQIDFDDSVEMDDPNKYYQFQYVNLIYDEDGNCSTGLDYACADELVVTDQPLAQVIADLFTNKK